MPQLDLVTFTSAGYFTVIYLILLMIFFFAEILIKLNNKFIIEKKYKNKTKEVCTVYIL